ncbi:MAG: HAD family phosphatase [Oscillospiraceae bacterium]|nr:HAD family phosphatase [Oscillospiraceae bacterium]
MLRGVIFDFDGTLFDSMFIWDSAGETYLRALGKEPEENLQTVLKPMSLRQSAAYIRRRYHLELSVEEIMQGIGRVVEDFYFHTVEPKPGVIPFLEELRQRNIGMCIATAVERYQAEAALERCGMRAFFSGIFTCSELGSGKDEPILYRTAMAHLGTDRGSTIVVEDAYHAIRTAKEDDFVVAAVFDAGEARQEEIRRLADCCLTDLRDTDIFWKCASAL